MLLEGEYINRACLAGGDIKPKKGSSASEVLWKKVKMKSKPQKLSFV